MVGYGVTKIRKQASELLSSAHAGTAALNNPYEENASGPWTRES